MNARFEFCSTPWIDAMRRIIEEEIDTGLLAAVEYSQSEEFSNPPEHLRHDGALTIGYTILIADGRVQVLDRPSVDVLFHVVGDYALMADVARTPFGVAGVPHHVAELLRRAVDAGTLHIDGSRAARPEALDSLGLHDRMAALTS